MTYDALLIVSFGGPESSADVLPFLRNVTRGRGIPEERLAEVAEHYYHFDGVSPINQWCRSLIQALQADFATHGVNLPIYWGNRNWPPMLVDAVQRMAGDGVQRALAFTTSAYGSYSSCRQYLEDLSAARAAVGSKAPAIDKIRHFFDHPGFIHPFADHLRQALDTVPASSAGSTRVLFTAHSIPVTMNDVSGPEGARYTDQVVEAAGLVMEAAGCDLPHDVVWQSRSGPPEAAWLEPDINDHIKRLAAEGVQSVVVSPVGFLSDHLEVLWDLDNEAKATATELGMTYHRAGTPGLDARVVTMIRELAAERTDGVAVKRLGKLPLWNPNDDGCCPARRPPAVGR
ncbi:ferrochelatase [Stackebrandtia endophytica]|uniref:Coproporphyrin III ferrochelatase n=1 Tax=Stackebrandtia endophytica TaxID=1496996 RepID=A0A543AQH0_9ACTN|nr:ferrochelatase [Stackebrandtia endophytica]TQL74841.1 ferrochelatase [Stackebrandtia endophytica]